MEELELGQATIVYEDPEEGVVEETLDNEQLVYARDHWMVKMDTDDQGNDLMHQIPRDRVHHVRRNVQTFEDEARSVRHQVENIAKDLQRKLPMGGDGRTRHRGGSQQEPHEIPVEEQAESDREREAGP
ncbi:hypothetical protein [Halomicrobium urmianum]|uniref:hypothetical protein n=1 Tax=Halomicrobium urmianum TaxID=1586233 RepID=UPI001CD9C80E|nr:hypothetical protein [Halomicrobium urmianum]